MLLESIPDRDVIAVGLKGLIMWQILPWETTGVLLRK